MSENFAADVVICGAGAAGLTLAIELARRGITFRLIDKMDEPFRGSRGKGIQPRTQEIFEDLGIIDRLVALARDVKVGDPTDPEVQMGPLISAAQLQRVQAHVDRALDDGAKLVSGGGRPAGLDTGFYFEPTILTEVTPDATIAQEEVFGPVLSVLRYGDDDDAVRIANNSQYGLSGAVWGTDVDRAVAVARRVRTGQIAVNGFGPGGAPFGGFNQSGFGRESGGIMGIRQYMEPKAMGLPA